MLLIILLNAKLFLFVCYVSLIICLYEFSVMLFIHAKFVKFELSMRLLVFYRAPAQSLGRLLFNLILITKHLLSCLLC